MGLLDFLFGRVRSRVESLDDSIWLTAAAKFRGISEDVRRMRPAGVAGVLLVAHFPDVLERLEPLAEDLSGVVPVEAVLARQLTSDTLAAWRLNDDSTLAVTVAERHPLPDHDDRIIEFAERLPCCCRVRFHVSLEDPLLRNFAGEWVEQTLRQLGMKEDEAIQSRLVTRRLRAAQQQMEQQAFGDSPAASTTEWLETNVPDWN